MLKFSERYLNLLGEDTPPRIMKVAKGEAGASLIGL